MTVRSSRQASSTSRPTSSSSDTGLLPRSLDLGLRRRDQPLGVGFRNPSDDLYKASFVHFRSLSICSSASACLAGPQVGGPDLPELLYRPASCTLGRSPSCSAAC